MRKRDLFKLLWLAGGALLTLGETATAFDSERGNTISEAWDRLPQPAKYFSILGIGCVLGHWVWPLPAREVVTVHAQSATIETTIEATSSGAS